MSDRKDVFSIIDKGPGKKAYWMKIGIAFVNKDGSLSIHLDALPIGGKLQVRDQREQSDNEGGGGGRW